MSALKKIAGVIAGLSTVAVVGVAVAQGVPPNPFISNPALGAGQQSTHIISMGETGVPGFADRVETAQIVTVTESVAVAPTPAPEPVASLPAPVQESQAMGAPPAEQPVAEAPAPMVVAKADRG